jgi:hypothetical protein
MTATDATIVLATKSGQGWAAEREAAMNKDSV